MKNIIAVTMLLFSSLAFSLPEEQGEITFLQLHHIPNGTGDSAQRYIVKLDGTISENNCGADEWGGYLNTEVDKAMYSTLLAMLVAGRSVKIEGTDADTCIGQNVWIRNLYPVL